MIRGRIPYGLLMVVLGVTWSASMVTFLVCRGGGELSSLPVLLFLGAIPAGIGLMLYLQRGVGTSFSYKGGFPGADADMRLDMLQRELQMMASGLRAMEKELEQVRTLPSALGDEQRRALVDAFAERIRQESSAQLLGQLEEKVRTAVTQEMKNSAVASLLDSTLHRLRSEVAALSQRGNLNLVLGILTTLAGLVVLGYYVFQTRAVSTDPWGFTCHFLPRLTLVIFIEVFAYFFLALYKASLGEIKYFQNEMTNVESRYAAVIMTLNVGQEGVVKDAIANLLSTERNYILKKGQTTVDLEKAKLDKDTVSAVANKILEVLSKRG